MPLCHQRCESRNGRLPSNIAEAAVRHRIAWVNPAIYGTSHGTRRATPASLDPQVARHSARRFDPRRLAAAQHAVALEQRALVDRGWIEPVILTHASRQPVYRECILVSH